MTSPIKIVWWTIANPTTNRLTNHAQIEGEPKTLCGRTLEDEISAVKGKDDRFDTHAICLNKAEEIEARVRYDLERLRAWNEGRQ